MKTYHADDLEVEEDGAHSDSPWVDVVLSDWDGEEHAPAALIKLSASEARRHGQDLIDSADPQREATLAPAAPSTRSPGSTSAAEWRPIRCRPSCRPETPAPRPAASGSETAPCSSISWASGAGSSPLRRPPHSSTTPW